MANANGLKRTCLFLGDQDRLAIARIRARLDLPSDGLAVRYSLRLLDKRLTENPPTSMVETALMLGGREVPQPEQPASNDGEDLK